jgi:hypothetical protein
MGADMVPVRGQLSFWRIMDIPFEACVAALDNWQRTGLGGEFGFGRMHAARAGRARLRHWHAPDPAPLDPGTATPAPADETGHRPLVRHVHRS